jgi:fructose-bisphosphate aldolase, class I
MDLSIQDIAKQLVQEGKGILAADESTPSCNKRFAAFGIEESEEMRRQYRQLLLQTLGNEEFLSGVILYDETIRQKNDSGILFAEVLQNKGILSGIKVDQGLVDFEGHPGEKITQGLDGLSERLQEYFAMGARFTKWRAVVAIGQNTPTQDLLQKNAEILAKYAKIAQTANFVPIVEPEVLLEGDHTIEQAEEVTTNTLKKLFAECEKAGVDFEALILKSSMVLSGKECRTQASAKVVAEATVRTFKNCVPKEVAGIVFLSGGQSPSQATENLFEIIKLGKQDWPITFSFSRALQEPVLALWNGENRNVQSAQQVFFKRLKLNQAALFGTYRTNLE